MQMPDIQMLRADTGWYTGAIDGDAGPKTWAAVSRAEQMQGTNYRDAPSPDWCRSGRAGGSWS